MPSDSGGGSRSSEATRPTEGCDDEGQSLLLRTIKDLPEIEHEHYSARLPWLRAAVLGANDGLVTTAGVIMGMAANTTDRSTILLSAISVLFAGAFSMACGEYVSIAAQRDSENAELKRERDEFHKGELHEKRELLELAQLYASKGISQETALKAAQEIHKNADRDLDSVVKIHLKEELNVDIENLSNPTLAAVSSSISFISGGLLPLLTVLFPNSHSSRLGSLMISSLVSFIITGMLASYLTGAGMRKGIVRMLVGGFVSNRYLCSPMMN